jgi:predicted 3-demethylubiquinone-9 3-methyltransferase (glyoxalase superfamily)
MQKDQKIVPCLWYDGDGEEAAEFYVSVFGGGVVSVNRLGGEKPVTVEFEIVGLRVVALNGGPQYRFTPALSLFVTCETRGELEEAWGKISDGGNVMMPLDEYEWGVYGWTADRFGMTWQLMLGPVEQVGQRIVPCFLFVGEQFGRGEEAIGLWTSLFPDSPVDGILRYGPGEPGREGTVKHAQFALAGGKFMVMDGPGEHAFGFSEAVSLMVACADQKEIDHFWDALTSEGGSASMCGWLKDRFGVSWQIIPENIGELLARPEALQAMFGMTKIEIGKLTGA